MTIADHPLHRSGLALLTHPALALGGNAQASDFLWSFIIVLCLSASRHALGLFAQRTPGSPGSRADCVRTCMGPLTAPSTSLAHQIASNIVAFPIPLQGRHPSFFFFRGSIPSLHAPLSMRRPRSRERRRMTRGHRVWLGLQCQKLAFLTICRFIPAHRRVNNEDVS